MIFQSAGRRPARTLKNHIKKGKNLAKNEEKPCSTCVQKQGSQNQHYYKQSHLEKSHILMASKFDFFTYCDLSYLRCTKFCKELHFSVLLNTVYFKSMFVIVYMESF